MQSCGCVAVLSAMVFSLMATAAARARSLPIRSCAFLSSASIQNTNAWVLGQYTPSAPAINTARLYASNYDNNQNKEQQNPNDFSLSGYQRPKVNWYPGHIAKAERQLSETLKSVDVVIEVRDARAPKATAHPSVGKWTAGRPRVVVLTRVDTVTTKSRESWRDAYEQLGADRWEERLGGEERNRNAQLRRERDKYADPGEEIGDDSAVIRSVEDGVEEVLFVDAKRGQGTHAISRAVYRAGRHVNERRNRRGLNDRPLRVGIIGFPNVGKVSCLVELEFGHVGA